MQNSTFFKINKSYLIITISVICVLLYCEMSFAQSITSSPYSRFAAGDVFPVTTGMSNAMGGAGCALRDGRYINLLNPASLSVFKRQSFVFETGVMSNFTTFKTTDYKNQTNNTSFSHLALGFPVTGWWGATLGIRPNSSVGYQISDEKYISSIGTAKYLYTGNGGVNQFFLGNGFRWKDLSAGALVSFLFGTMNRTGSVDNDLSNSFGYLTETRTSVGDIDLNFGIQYTHRIDTFMGKALKEGLEITAGVSLHPEKDLYAQREELSMTYKGVGEVKYIRDTVLFSETSGNMRLPLGIRAGISVNKGERWLFLLDFSFQNWERYKVFGVGDSLRNNFAIAAAVQFTPAGEKQGGFFTRNHYRFGGRFEKTRLMLNNLNLSEYALSAGIGFPMTKSNSTINIGVEAGVRGTTENKLVQEQFIRLYLGLSMNDVWFIKRKYD